MLAISLSAWLLYHAGERNIPIYNCNSDWLGGIDSTFVQLRCSVDGSRAVARRIRSSMGETELTSILSTTSFTPGKFATRLRAESLSVGPYATPPSVTTPFCTPIVKALKAVVP